MQPVDWLTVLARISLPCVLAVLMQLLPVPADFTSSLQAGYRAEQAGNSLEAAHNYARVAEIQPWRSGLLEKTGLLYLQNNDLENATLALQAALDKGELSTQGQISLADAWYQTQKYDQALSIWSALIKDPNVDESLFKDITDKLTTAGLMEDQVAVYRQWVSKYPDNSQACYRLGLLQSVYDPVEAVTYLSLGKSLDSSLSEPTSLLLDTLASLQDSDERYRLVMTGRALGNIGEWEIANRAFQKAVDLDPEYGDAWAFLAESLQQLGKPALQAVETANQLSPDSIGVKAISALYWRRQNKPERAMKIIQEIIDLQPGEYVWLIEMGNTVAQTGDLEGALKYFQQAINAEPDNPVWRKELITFCLQNNYEIRTLALPNARVYLKSDHEGPRSLEMMGRVMLDLKDALSAERYLIRALEMDPSNASVHLYLGQVYLLESSQEQAFNHLTSAYSMASRQSETAQLAQRLLEKYFPEGAAN